MLCALHLKLIQCHMSIISQNWGKICFKKKKVLSYFKLTDKRKSFLKHESSTKVAVISSGHNKLSVGWLSLYIFPQTFAFFFFFFGEHATRLVGSQSPNQGSNPGPQQWKHRVLTTGPPGKSPDICFYVSVYVSFST